MNPLEKIQSIFEKYTTGYHFYLRDLRNGQEYELGEKKRYPICSCFKLAVLMAYFKSIKEVEELFEEVTISPDEFSQGGGITNFFNSSVKFTIFNLAQMMMGFSDGTATDKLIERVGMPKIKSVLKKECPESNLSQNLDGMVKDFSGRFDIATLKNQTDDCYRSYTFSDYSNAIDLANLARAADLFEPENKDLLQFYRVCIETKKQLPRTSLFFPSDLKTIGKGGSLGHVFFGNDCGVVISNGAPLFSFGITAYGFKHDKDINELIFGIIGLNILDFFSIAYTPSNRWCRKTEELLA